MKITIYTISDCYFSKQEKEYLQSHNLPFEERNLEENRDFLTEMLTISNNFAGTPVTKIEKDDGQIVVLKGFTRDEFDKTLEVSTPAVVEPSEPQITVQAPAVAPVVQEPPSFAAVEPALPKIEPVAPKAAPSTPQVDLDSIAAQIEQLKKLQESLAAQTATAPAPTPAPVVPAYQAPAPQPVAPQPVASQPAQAQAVQPAQSANVDDSLAAILAELQTKINSSPAQTTTTAPPTTS